MSTKSWAVTALPSCHFRLLRSFSKIDRLSGASCQDSARSGLALPTPSFHSRREKTWSYISKLTAEKFHGLTLLKSPPLGVGKSAALLGCGGGRRGLGGWRGGSSCWLRRRGRGAGDRRRRGTS